MSSVAKQKSADVSKASFWPELFRAGLYKPNQGRIVRQVTFASIALLGLLVAWEIQRTFLLDMGLAGYGVMLAIAAAFAWIGFRLVSYSVFADFLIAVEAEMNKVSWPGRAELWRASVVVMFVIFAMAAFLFVFDLVWTAIFEFIGIRYSGGGFVDTLLKTIGLR
jgi:preprotein translocase subunit SecE